MLKLSEWLDDELVDATDALLHLRIDDEPENIDYLERITIPAARGMAEEITGSILRRGIYVETILSGQTLAKGNVERVDSVKANGLSVPFRSELVAGRTLVVVPQVGPAAVLEVTFEAGYKRENYPPQLRSWLLMVCGFLFRERDLSKDSPKIRSLDFMLTSMTIPSLF